MNSTPVNLRTITESDLPNFVVWLNDPEVVQYTSVVSGTITLEGEQDWLAKISADPNSHDWAIEAAGRNIGVSSLHANPNQPTAYFGIIIGDKSAWGQGFGTAVLKEALRRGFEDLGLEKIFLTVRPENSRARHCYEKCGFRYEGHERRAYLKAGEWIDRMRMALLRGEWQAMQAPPSDGLCNLGPEHIEEAVELWKDVGFRLTVGPDKVRRFLAANSRFCVGWRLGGKLVGTALANFDQRVGMLWYFAVKRKYQSRGIGTQMLAELEKRLAAAGAHYLFMTVAQDNAQAIALYERLNYSKCALAYIKGLDGPTQGVTS